MRLRTAFQILPALAAMAVMAVLARAADPAPAVPIQYNVLDYGAVGEGITDNTVAFQTALDAVGKAGGGIIVAPTGRYLFKGHLVFPWDVSLRGTIPTVPSHAGVRDGAARPLPQYGTVLMPTENKGNENGDPFILLNDNCTLSNLVIYYPDQADDDVPAAYPFAIAMRGNNPAVTDVETLNPYKAIDASQNQRAMIRNVHGQPLRMGIWIDSIYDIGRVENVHWNPFWSVKPKLFDWQLQNGEAFVFGRTDWHYVLNTFAFGYKVGYKFIKTKNGATNGNFLGIGADRCGTAILVEDSAPYGILITNGEFTSFDEPDPTILSVGPENGGVVRLVNCAFWGPHNHSAVIAGHGTDALTDCNIHDWDRKKEGLASIVATGGTVMVRGCNFDKNAPQVEIGADVEAAIVTDNVVTGDVRIKVAEGANARVDGNLGRKKKPRK